MTMYANYKSKKALKEAVGRMLDYTETSMFGPEYKSDGQFVVTNVKRSFFAQVTMKDNVIAKVT
jgi:hypothetical protein